MIKLPVLTILTISSILGAWGLMVWRSALAMHRGQILRSIVWGFAAGCWIISWGIAFAMVARDVL